MNIQRRFFARFQRHDIVSLNTLERELSIANFGEIRQAVGMLHSMCDKAEGNRHEMGWHR